jgi:tetratricopeptide (TPR) repeat protein
VHNRVQFWKGESYPALAGYFQKQLAQKAGGPQAWTRAGNFFQQAQKEVTDSVVKQVAINQAMTCFKTALDRKPKSLEAKAGLALTYIEGKQQVMQGVSLLKEIVKKARTRFQKLVEIQPQNPFNHLYLGNVQEQLGNKEAALQEFRKYQKLVNQPKLKANAEEKINALKQSQKN